MTKIKQLTAVALGSLSGLLLPFLASASSDLSIVGGHFMDGKGRGVMLRGFNLSGSAKNPPYLPLGGDLSSLDRLPALGANVVRLVFSWEAYEPEPGFYEEPYLDSITKIVDAAWDRGIYTVIDMHEDGFSRYVGFRCGDGFPGWAVPESHRKRYDFQAPPACSRFWSAGVLLSPGMHSAFKSFYADRTGARTRFLELWGRLIERFKTHPGVIGYDLINEPWGNEISEITPLYRDVAEKIHSIDPGAFIFFEPNTAKAAGTRLPGPSFANAVFAPHYYNIPEVVTNSWNLGTDRSVRRSFGTYAQKASAWNVPLFVGEFGAAADTTKVGDYLRYVYDQLDLRLASGTQWNYTPEWNASKKDGWNNEDFSIVGDEGRLRENFIYRPYVQRTSGELIEQKVSYDAKGGFRSFHARWRNAPATGSTEIYLPRALSPERGLQVLVDDPNSRCSIDAARPYVLVCASDSASLIDLECYVKE